MSSSRKQHSANVDLSMTIGGLVVGLSQVGPMHAILDQATSIPPDTTASIEVVIDGKTFKREVMLYDGACGTSRQVEFF